MGNENDDHGRGDEPEKSSSLADRLKELYEDRPIPFALGLMAISALAMIVGFAMLGDNSVIAPGPFFQDG